jgi:hypothetical protein
LDKGNYERDANLTMSSAKERNLVTDTAGRDVSSDWKRFMRKHWRTVATFVVAGILAVAGAIYVFLWFVGNAQSSGLVPRTLGLWTMANLVNFILYAIFWEILLVGIPVVAAVAVAWLLWKRLAGEEMKGYRLFRKRSRTTRGSGGVSLFFFIAFCIKVYLDGNWNVPISTFTLDYVIGSMVLILEWTLIILGIPAAIAAILWIRYRMKKP